MSRAVLVRPDRPFGAPSCALERAAVRLADAVAEYDAALEQGAPMPVLVRLDREVAAADRCHRAALAAS